MTFVDISLGSFVVCSCAVSRGSVSFAALIGVVVFHCVALDSGVFLRAGLFRAVSLPLPGPPTTDVYVMSPIGVSFSYISLLLISAACFLLPFFSADLLTPLTGVASYHILIPKALWSSAASFSGVSLQILLAT